MKKSKILASALAIAISLLLVQCTNNEKRLHKELYKMAINLNQSAPAALDQHTRFDSAAVTSDNIFQYYYTITDIENPKELLREKKDEIISEMEKAFATDRSLQIFVVNKVPIEYIYRDTSQSIIDIIRIDATNYNK